MELGGNTKARNFFRDHGHPSGKPGDYRSKIAERYKKELDKEVNDFINPPPESETQIRSPLDHEEPVLGPRTSVDIVSENEKNLFDPEDDDLFETASAKKKSDGQEESPPSNGYQSGMMNPLLGRVHHQQIYPPPAAKQSLKLKTGAFDFDFDSAFALGTAPGSRTPPSETFVPQNKTRSSKSRKDLETAKAISYTDFSPRPPSPVRSQDTNFLRFKGATSISSAAFFGGESESSRQRVPVSNNLFANFSKDIHIMEEATSYLNQAKKVALDLAQAAHEVTSTKLSN